MKIKFSKEIINIDVLYMSSLSLLITLLLVESEILRNAVAKVAFISAIDIILLIVHQIYKAGIYISLTEKEFLSSKLKIFIDYSHIDEVFTKELYTRIKSYKGIFIKYNGNKVKEIKPYCSYSDYRDMITYIEGKNKNIKIEEEVRYLLKNDDWLNSYIGKGQVGGKTYFIAFLFVNIVLTISVFLF